MSSSRARPAPPPRPGKPTSGTIPRKARPDPPDRDRQCGKHRLSDIPYPAPPLPTPPHRLMQPTQVGGLGAPLPSGGSPEFTVRQSAAMSTALQSYLSCLLPRTLTTVTDERKCNVCACPTPPQPPPRLPYRDHWRRRARCNASSRRAVSVGPRTRPLALWDVDLGDVPPLLSERVLCGFFAQLKKILFFIDIPHMPAA